MKKVFLIANTHIDPVWLWDKYEGTDEVINSFRSACDRLDENPDLYFSASSLAFYKWTRDLAPDVFERIRKYVKEGRWEVTGRWLVENDVNLPLKESFENSCRISTEFMQKEFGITTPVAYSPDTFGHPAALPEILYDQGFRYYVFCRPAAHEKELPANLFWWEHNGKRILCQRLKYHYTQGRTPDMEQIKQKILDPELLQKDTGCFFFGIGDHGGGPSKEEIAYLQKLRDNTKDIELKFGTCLEYFRYAEKLPDIPTVTGDLHMHAIGCYSVNRSIKEGVRSCERGLNYTKRIADAAGTPANLDSLWEKVAFNEFHDILPGSCSPAAAKQAVDELASVRTEAMDTAYRAAKKISRAMPVKYKSGEFRIYNSLPYPVKGPFEVESFMYYRPEAAFRKYDGTLLDCQMITPSVYCANRRWLFIDEIPALSMASYAFDSDTKVEREEEFGFTNGDRISVDNYEIKKLNLFRNGKAVFAAPLSLRIYKDESDTWSHGIDGYHYGTAGEFELSETAKHEGPLASYCLYRLNYGKSEAEICWTLYKGMPFADINIKIHWTEKQKVLKLIMSPVEEYEYITADAAGSPIRKYTVSKEEPLHGWLRFDNISFCQTGAFAYSRENKQDTAVTLVRSSIYGYDIGYRPDYKGSINYTDMGEHNFRFRIFTEKLSDEELCRKLAEFVEPFNVLRENS